MRRYKSRLLSFVTSLVLMMSLIVILPETALDVSAASSSSEYGIQICHLRDGLDPDNRFLDESDPNYLDLTERINYVTVPVTAKNRNDILGDGVLSYDATRKTLSIDGDLFGSVIFSEDASNAVFNVKGDSSILSPNNCIRSFSPSLTISGSGSLSLEGLVSGYSVVIVLPEKNNCKLTVNNTVIKIKSSNGLDASDSWVDEFRSSLVINNSAIDIDFELNGISGFCGGVKMSLCGITDPADTITFNTFGMPYFRYGDNSGNLANYQSGINHMTVSRSSEAYGFSVDDQTVTDINKDRICDSNDNSYDPDSNTLTLNSGSFEGKLLNYGNKDLTIKLGEKCRTVTSEKDWIFFFLQPTTVIGSDKNISVHSAEGDTAVISTESDLTLKYLKKVNISGSIEGPVTLPESNAVLSVDTCYLHLRGKDFAVSGFNGGIKFNNCRILSPAGAVVKNGAIYESDGKTPAGEVIIAPFDKVLLGDVNRDDKITADDAIITARYAADFSDYRTRYNGQIADINNDGLVTADDAIIIARVAAGYGDYCDRYIEIIDLV